ncbi:MAG TPA: hypothetical protein DCF66_03750 [Lachnospiraceae bacterium]|nr:hypothetical protein [Lachnospiraceae bacterium]
MKYSEISSMIESFGLPSSYYQFPEGTEQAPPFICFFYPQADDLHADDSNYQTITQLAIELYTDAKDIGLECEIESKLKAAGLSWSKDSEYIDSEKLYVTVYLMEVIINAEE